MSIGTIALCDTYTIQVPYWLIKYLRENKELDLCCSIDSKLKQSSNYLSRINDEEDKGVTKNDFDKK